MREANTFDLSLLILLAIIWGSSFFNIKIATYSYDPITLALVRVIFASVPLLILCKIKKIKVEAFDKNWQWFALIGLCNITIPFVLIAIGTAKINSYLAAILMSTTPLSGSILAHIFTKDEKLSFLKSLGVLIGFTGIVLLFFDEIIINNEIGLLTDPGNPSSLKEIIVEAIHKNWDNEYIYEYSQKFTWEKISEKIYELYEEI